MEVREERARAIYIYRIFFAYPNLNSDNNLREREIIA